MPAGDSNSKNEEFTASSVKGIKNFRLLIAGGINVAAEIHLR